MYTNSFQEFRKIYPRKVGKLIAFKSFENVAKKYATAEEIIDGARRYSEHCSNSYTEKKYIKHPSTRLNAGCWDDVIEDL